MGLKDMIRNDPDRVGGLLRLYNRLLGSNSIRLSGNVLHCPAALLRRVRIRIEGTGNRIEIGKGCLIQDCTIVMRGNGNLLRLGEQCTVKEAEFYLEDDGNSIVFGDDVGVYGKTHFAALERTSIRIGNRCRFSSDIQLRTSDSHSILDETGCRINPAMDIVVGDHVWFATRTMCLKGGRIPDGCIVGAGTIVTKPFTQPCVILAGSPARVVRTGIDWCHERLPVGPAPEADENAAHE